MGDLERAVDPVVVGQRERGVAELDRTRDELLRVRRAVDYGDRRVAVKIDIRGLN